MKQLFILICLVSMTSTFAQQTLTPELLWKLNRVAGGTVSSDGNYVLYTQRSFDITENKGNTEIFVYNVKDGQSTQITTTSLSENEVQWGTGNSIWFISNENEGAQIWSMSVDGSNKTQRSHFKDVELEGFKLAADGTFLVAIEAVKVVKTVNEKYPDLAKANVRIEDDLMYRHWDHFDDGKKRQLFIHKIEGGAIQNESKNLLEGEVFDGCIPPFGGGDHFDICPEGKTIIYASKKKSGKDFATSTNSDLYAYTIASGTTKNLTVGNLGYDNNPQFSSNGLVAWTAMEHDGFEADKNDLMIRDENGKNINLTKNFDITVSSFRWHPDNQSIYFISPTAGTEQIFVIDIKSQKIKQITSEKVDYVSLSLSSKYLYAGKQSMIAPTDLVSIDLKNNVEKQITFANKEQLKGIVMPKVEETWVTTTDGKQMLVWMIYPPNMKKEQKYPSLLYCQGGPQSMVSQFFSYRWNLALMASQGYIVIAPNRRGLPGFGQEWNDAISKDWGGQAMKDYLTATDEAAKNPNVDKDRIGAVGASYGGYSVFMLAGIHENRFKTFISHCGLFNLESWYGTTEELFFANWDHGGPYWEEKNKENYAKNSPHKYVANWNTPIMVIQGGMDFRVPEAEGMQAFQAAQLKGLKSRYLYLPEESHWVTSPQNSLVWQREFFTWLGETLK
ncbi:MAG: S9 family peptidase [Bacteroidota bacterium]